MDVEQFFPKRTASTPTIYAYSDERFPGCLKVGYTTRDPLARIAEQYPVKTPSRSYVVVLTEPATRPDGSTFNDRAVHKVLERMGIERLDGEWFRCGVKNVKTAIIAVRDRTDNTERRDQDFKPRPEQEAAIQKTLRYFEEQIAAGKTPRFLWNAKMRFGKTFATYQLARRGGYKSVLVLTFKPAVKAAWREDLTSHVDFEGWSFLDKSCRDFGKGPGNRERFVGFGSFQDFLRYDSKTKRIKSRNEWVHTRQWDLIVFDEYHFGAWRDNAKNLFDGFQNDTEETEFGADRDDELLTERLNESWLPISGDRYLYLSGTPFRALSSGEFIEDQIFNWTYSDEQKAKADWRGPDNPYAALPQLVMATYRLPDSVRQIAMKEENNEFDLNEFFAADDGKTRGKKQRDVDAVIGGDANEPRFRHEEYVQKWLDLIRGARIENDDLKMGEDKPAWPYSDARLLELLSHTLWYLPNVAACRAMANLLSKPQNAFYRDNYKVVVCAGPEAGIGAEALKPVEKAMGNDPFKTRTITLSCGKLTTGVTVKPWTGVLMLRNLKSPETYFQTAFRAQSPWEVTDENNKAEIVKQKCYLFDFALDRALKQIADYGCQLNVGAVSPEKKVEEIVGFLPVLAYDGASMKQIDAAGILEYALSGTTATLLARRWESPLLVNVDNETLARILASPEALRALERLSGFRALNNDIEVIINKSDAVKKLKKSDKELSKAEKKQMDEDEEEYKSKRKQIREKLIKFITRIPIFMYLSDYREECLKDVITRLEPRLFEKVTGITVDDFELLCSLEVFNTGLMNDAVYKFKRYEDASLNYLGIDLHKDENVGLFDEKLDAQEYARLREQQEASMYF